MKKPTSASSAILAILCTAVVFTTILLLALDASMPRRPQIQEIETCPDSALSTSYEQGYQAGYEAGQQEIFSRPIEEPPADTTTQP